MRKKIPSIVIASAVAYGVAAPAPALAQGTGDNNNSIASAQSIGLGAANDPLGVLLGIVGMSAIAPFILSSWAGVDILPQ
ncbi:hypothetical protein [Corynebacterium casei]|uniref:hypothetical protein n=1 Tax=Corynebacterium casei TaxID=160386 RepID=UPI003F8E2A83